MLTFEWSDWRCGWWWWIQSVYVGARAPPPRRVPRAVRALLELAAADAEDVCGLRLYVERENTSAHRTYEFLGMVDSGLSHVRSRHAQVGFRSAWRCRGWGVSPVPSPKRLLSTGWGRAAIPGRPPAIPPTPDITTRCQLVGVLEAVSSVRHGIGCIRICLSASTHLKSSHHAMPGVRAFAVTPSTALLIFRAATALALPPNPFADCGAWRRRWRGVSEEGGQGWPPVPQPWPWMALPTGDRKYPPPPAPTSADAQQRNKDFRGKAARADPAPAGSDRRSPGCRAPRAARRSGVGASGTADSRVPVAPDRRAFVGAKPLRDPGLRRRASRCARGRRTRRTSGSGGASSQQSSSGASSAVSSSGQRRAEAGVVVLHRDHRGEVVHGQVARVFDGRRRSFAARTARCRRRPCRCRAGSLRVARRPRPRSRASPRSTKGSRRSGAAGVVGVGLQVAAAGMSRSAKAITRAAGAGRLGDQPFEFAVQGPAAGAAVRPGRTGRPAGRGRSRRPRAPSAPGRARPASASAPARLGRQQHGPARVPGVSSSASAPWQAIGAGHGASIRPGLESRAGATKLWRRHYASAPRRPCQGPCHEHRPVASPSSAASASPSARTTPPTSTSATSACRSRRSARWSRNSACRASSSAKSRWARCSSIPRTGTSAARRRCPRDCRRSRRASRCSAPAAPAWTPSSPSPTRSRSARSRPASAAAPTPPRDVPIAVNKRLRRRLLNLNMARSFGERARRGGQGLFASPNSSRSSPASASRAPARAWASTARRWRRNGRSRATAQDLLAFESHQKAAAAYERGFFKDLVVPFRGLERDNILRAGHHAGKTRHAQARLRQALGPGHADRRQLDQPVRRRLGGAAVVGRMGARAWQAGAGLAGRRAGRGGGFRARRRPADGADRGGGADAQAQRPDACRISISTRSTKPSPRRCCAR